MTHSVDFDDCLEELSKVAAEVGNRYGIQNNETPVPYIEQDLGIRIEFNENSVPVTVIFPSEKHFTLFKIKWS